MPAPKNAPDWGDLPLYLRQHVRGMFNPNKGSGLTVVHTSMGGFTVGMLLTDAWQRANLELPVRNAPAILTATATNRVIVVERHIDALEIGGCEDICSSDVIRHDGIVSRVGGRETILPLERVGTAADSSRHAEIALRLTVLSYGIQDQEGLKEGLREDLFAANRQPADAAFQTLAESMEGHSLEPSTAEVRGHLMAGNYAGFTVTPRFVDLAPHVA
ncbi:MAG TPA: hypothetical protein VLF71_04180 [Candidatus Saccharimonadales bacterium]|nr:hypothetical protein [Candidatus Saccharimonadales bacterium]